MKVAILGTVALHRQLAPFDDPEWEIWVCSPGNAHGTVPRVTKWFELHGIEDLKGAENAAWNARYFDWLKQQTFPIIMQEPNDLVPGASVFPLKKLLAEFGDLGRIAFTSSISLMTAYAITQMTAGDEIRIYGVDMAATEEQYGGQKAGCQIMMAIAKARGIRVSLPLESTLGCPPPIYGYAEATRMGRALYARKLLAEQNIANLTNQANQIQYEIAFQRGQLEQVNFALRTYVDGADAELDLPEPKVPEVIRPEFGTYDMGPGGVLMPRREGMNGSGVHQQE